MQVLEGEHPGLANTASGQASGTGALERMHDNTCDSVATITEYTCVYVAMMIINSPKLRDPGQAGQNVRTAVGLALVTLRANWKANIFNDRVNEIQEALDEAVEDTK